MYRDEDDLQLLTELAGVLDQVVIEAGLSSGSCLLLRELAAEPDGRSLAQLAEIFGTDTDEIASAAGSFTTAGITAVEGSNMVATGVGRQVAVQIESDGNVAFRT